MTTILLLICLILLILLGMPIGFATGRILAEATDSELGSWPVLVVAHANYVTSVEKKALARYVSRGGTLVVSGAGSLKRDEYARPHGAELETGRGRLLRLGDANSAAVAAQVFSTVNNVKQLNEMTDAEINDTFVAMSNYCGSLFVTKMRRHAG